MQIRYSSCILNIMPGDLLARLKTSAVLCDGAMGTLLYSKGIFINQCYDELNLSQPDLIRGIHRDYLQAGPANTETNPFRANRFGPSANETPERTRGTKFARRNLA